MTEYIYERPDEPAKVVRDGWNVHIEWDFKQREEIIRCRDCRHYHSYQDLCERLKPGMVVTGDGYCAWGERRGE